MHDTELYQRILGITLPWQVKDVKLDAISGNVDIFLGHNNGELWACPECGELLPCRDHVEERVWRHLDTCQFKTIIHARIPRIKCEKHGVLRVKVPWAEVGCRFTILMEIMIIKVIEQCYTLTGACRLLGISWDEAHGVMDRAVKRGQSCKKKEPISHIGIDEKAFKKGHSYLTLVYNLQNPAVEYISDDRTTASLEEYYTSLNSEELEHIQAICMDMWEAYFVATVKHIPNATEKIVHDKFHIMQYVSKAVNTVRRKENIELLKENDTSLKGSKFLWLYRPENIPQKRQEEFEKLRNMDLKVSKAWAMKENLQRLWDYKDTKPAEQYFEKWLTWVIHSSLEPMKKVAKMLKRHQKNILTFILHRITNGVAEGINSKIMSVKRKARGYRNKEHFKTAIYFFCGGLNLFPETP